MTEPRHLRTVPPSIADQLATSTDEALIARARQVAEDFKAPTAHKHLSPSEWANLAGWTLGEVQRHVFDTGVISGPRPRRQARSEIERAIGLLLVLDDALRDLEDEQDPTRQTPA